MWSRNKSYRFVCRGQGNNLDGIYGTLSQSIEKLCCAENNCLNKSNTRFHHQIYSVSEACFLPSITWCYQVYISVIWKLSCTDTIVVIKVLVSFAFNSVNKRLPTVPFVFLWVPISLRVHLKSV